MTPIEFFSRLKQTNPDTPLSIAHLGAVFEMVKTMLVRQPSAITPLSARLTDEISLANWLDEPIATIQGWRISASIKYRLGSVCDWIAEHSILNAPSVDTEQAYAALASSHIPAMLIGEKFLGFFLSLEEETEPAGYELFHIVPNEDDPWQAKVRALQPSRMPRDEFIYIADSLALLGKFTETIGKSSADAKNIYGELTDEAMPEIRLLFFRSALAFDMALAKMIADALDPELIRKGFSVCAWLWTLLLENPFCELETDVLIDAFAYADESGVNLNQNSHVQDKHQQEVFHGTASHLLADTTGDFYKRHPIDGCTNNYRKLLNFLFTLGLKADKENNQKHTGNSIALAIEEKHGKGQSLFKLAVEQYEGFQLMPRNDTDKPIAKRRKQPV
jgi:hypothetical protein